MKNIFKVAILSLIVGFFSSCQYFADEQSFDLPAALGLDCNFNNAEGVYQQDTTFFQDTAYTEPYTVSGGDLTFKMGLNNPIPTTNPLLYPKTTYTYRLFYLSDLGNGQFEQKKIEKSHGKHTALFSMRPVQICSRLQIEVKFCDTQGHCVNGPITNLMQVIPPQFCCE
jgi:hypothetical protein